MYLESARILLSIIMLGYTSWVDIKTREIYDLVWIIFGGLGLALNIYEVVTGVYTVIDVVVPVAFAAGISIVLGFIGLFGGADVLAFIALSLLNPFPPMIVHPLLGIVSRIYPITMVSNSALAGVSMSLVILARNLAFALQGENLFSGNNVSGFKKFVLLFSGYRIDMDQVKGPPFQYPLEVPSEEGEDRKLVVMPNINDDGAAVSAFNELRNQGVTRTWVSYTLPFLLFISVGYVLSIIFGDIALYVITQLIF